MNSSRRSCRSPRVDEGDQAQAGWIRTEYHQGNQETDRPIGVRVGSAETSNSAMYRIGLDSESVCRALAATEAAFGLRAPSAWLAKQPVGRFQFTFTPTHGSWLIHRGLLFQVHSFGAAPSASNPKRNSRIVSWPPWITSIRPIVHTWSYGLDGAK